MGRKFTDEETKQFLESIQDFSRKNQEKKDQIEELRAVAESCTVRTDKESVQSSGNADKMAKIIGKIVDLEREIAQTEKIIKHRKATFEEISRQMKNEKRRDFLTIRYIDGHGFYDTAMILDISDSTAKKIRKESISEFTKLLNYTTFSGNVR